ncbi:MAG: hypothetical protein A2V77_05030 [Anaeromyxobacter sp. RBG_16_69_14]|nr:MAG: hypothetical protein A2V77_05030 [Anaeromyxobacter sp. RBG_16_69_14]
MITRMVQVGLTAVAALLITVQLGSAAYAWGTGASSTWQEEFDISRCNLVTTGRNPYFVLEPGVQLVYEGGDAKLQITVLDETKVVNGVRTRVVEEKEWKDGKLHEIAKNYFAMCEQTKDVLYFGEDVDFYEDGKVVKHDGSWLAGNGNRPGLMMAGEPKVKMKYYQELAPGVAMDRAEIVSLDETCQTPAGTFSSCMKVKETSAIDVTASEHKYYAPAIGLVRDEALRLTRYTSARVDAVEPSSGKR